jgi:uncharacterized YigZ family protein
MNTWFTIEKEQEVRQKILGSTFLTYLIPLKTLPDFESFLSALRKEHFKANHHCQAYRLGPDPLQEFSSDDGEPSGSSGPPMLGVLKSRQLINVGAIVVRYFGGTKLGIRGLMDAYSSSVVQAVEAAEIVALEERYFFQVTFAYDRQSDINTLLHPLPVVQESVDYQQEVHMQLSIVPEHAPSLQQGLQQMAHLGVNVRALGKRLGKKG